VLSLARGISTSFFCLATQRPSFALFLFPCVAPSWPLLELLFDLRLSFWVWCMCMKMCDVRNIQNSAYYDTYNVNSIRMIMSLMFSVLSRSVYYYHPTLHGLLLLLSSSLSPLCRVFINIFLTQILSLSNKMLQLLCHYCLWCPYH
jgi:hypothetical protein